LRRCLAILKPGGQAVFGEPLAIGYGLSAAALKAATDIVGVRIPRIDAHYDDLRYRIAHANSREALTNLVDKHLFFQRRIADLARDIGFSAIDFRAPEEASFYREHAIDKLFNELGVEDSRVMETARKMYSSLVDLFGTDTSYIEALASFMYLVLEKARSR
jgi:hypothetical protein